MTSVVRLEFHVEGFKKDDRQRYDLVSIHILHGGLTCAPKGKTEYVVGYYGYCLRSLRKLGCQEGRC